jgi:hypothetical protein
MSFFESCPQTPFSSMLVVYSTARMSGRTPHPTLKGNTPSSRAEKSGGKKKKKDKSSQFQRYLEGKSMSSSAYSCLATSPTLSRHWGPVFIMTISFPHLPGCPLLKTGLSIHSGDRRGNLWNGGICKSGSLAGCSVMFLSQ